MIMDYPGEPSVIPRGLIRERQEDQSQRKVERCYTVCFEDGGRGHRPLKVGGPLEAGKAKKTFSLECPGGGQPCPRLDFSQ